MRLTTLTMLASLTGTAGCLAEVGGGECTSERCKDDPKTKPTSVTCTDANTEEKTTNLVLRTAADFATLPTGCWSLNANLRIEGAAITSLAKLGDLTEVNDLELVDTGLTTVDAKQQLKVYGSLLVSGNTKLASLANLAVKKWDGPTQGGTFSVAYTVRNNALLANLDGLKYIAKVDGDLRISDNPKLGALELGELTTIGGGLYVTSTGAPSLAISQLASVGRVEISTNPQLASIHGFAATAIRGDLVLRGNPALTSVGAMSSLTTISGNLTIDDNDALVDLASLTGTMQRITGTVVVSGNAQLTALGQLGHLTGGIGATVEVTNNPKLPSCRAVEIDHCVQSGTVTIQGNLPGTNCNCWCGR